MLALSTALLVGCDRDRAGTYTLQDFANLHWLEGSWRGAVPNDGFFYEVYRVLDDSTIAMRGFEDSTLTHPNDSASIMFRAGRIVDSSTSSRYSATGLDPNRIDFAPDQANHNHFSWVRESPDRWTATLRSADGKTITYPMARVRR